ncbi:MAG: hypothetical protein VX730_07600 [Pseudomonadota bacterium]|nr:hypothetical protein [Pseudomonadota bacterium]
MTRALSSYNAAATSGKTVHPVIFVKIDYTDNPVYAHSDTGTLSFHGETFTGVGQLGSISGIEEQGDLAASGLTMTLAGIDPTLLSQAMHAPHQGRPVHVWIGYLDENRTLVDTPHLIFRGRLDTHTLTLGEQAILTLTAENRLVDWSRPRTLRFNAESQKTRFPADEGFAFVAQATEKTILWGRA